MPSRRSRNIRFSADLDREYRSSLRTFSRTRKLVITKFYEAARARYGRGVTKDDRGISCHLGGEGPYGEQWSITSPMSDRGWLVLDGMSYREYYDGPLAAFRTFCRCVGSSRNHPESIEDEFFNRTR